MSLAASAAAGRPPGTRRPGTRPRPVEVAGPCLRRCPLITGVSRSCSPSASGPRCRCLGPAGGVNLHGARAGRRGADHGEPGHPGPGQVPVCRSREDRPPIADDPAVHLRQRPIPLPAHHALIPAGQVDPQVLPIPLPRGCPALAAAGGINVMMTGQRMRGQPATVTAVTPRSQRQKRTACRARIKLMKHGDAARSRGDCDRFRTMPPENSERRTCLVRS